MSTLRITLAGLFTCLAIYLFISAPAPLPDHAGSVVNEREVTAERVFLAANAVNESARQIYTSRIVGEGKKVGLKFGEDWASPNIEKGPLPALFLRLVAQRLERKTTRLALYLGSDEPINQSNLFSPEQGVAFENLKATRTAVFSRSDTGGVVGMFPDVASSMPCVTCHNEHPDSPKTDWKLNDIMGATTWTYPQPSLGSATYLDTTEQVIEAVAEAYTMYLAKAAKFQDPVDIGSKWPSDGGLFLPNQHTFMLEVRKAASLAIVDELVLSSNEGGLK